MEAHGPAARVRALGRQAWTALCKDALVLKQVTSLWGRWRSFCLCGMVRRQNPVSALFVLAVDTGDPRNGCSLFYIRKRARLDLNRACTDARRCPAHQSRAVWERSWN